MNTTILQLSDIHFCEKQHESPLGIDPDLRLEQVIRTVRNTEVHPDLLLVSGDISDDFSQESYRRALSVLSRLEVPILATAGNHDDAAKLAEHFSCDETVVMGDWSIVAANSSLPTQVHGTLDLSELLKRIDGELARKPDQNVLVCIHHPIRSRSSHEWFQLDESDLLQAELLKRHQVKLITTGHVHDPFEFEIDRDGVDPLWLLGCPAVSLAIDHDGSNYELMPHSPTGFRVVTLKPDGSFASKVIEVTHQLLMLM